MVIYLKIADTHEMINIKGFSFLTWFVTQKDSNRALITAVESHTGKVLSALCILYWWNTVQEWS